MQINEEISSMQVVFKKAAEKEAATRASFHVVHLLAKKSKPFTDGKLIKKCFNKSQLKDKVSKFVCFSVAPDELID